MTKKRKSLDDSLASEFVFGESSKAENTSEATPDLVESIPTTPEKKNEKLSLMDKLQVKSKEATKRFTVDLAESMHRKLSILAAKTGRSKADIVRLLLDDALKDVKE